MEEVNNKERLSDILAFLQKLDERKQDIFWTTYRQLFLPARDLFQGQINQLGDIGGS
jgi:hypothetical protein